MIQFDNHIFSNGWGKTNQLEKISEKIGAPTKNEENLVKDTMGVEDFEEFCLSRCQELAILAQAFQRYDGVTWHQNATASSTKGLFGLPWNPCMVYLRSFGNAGKHTIHGSSGFGLAMYLLWSDGLVLW